MSQSRHSSAHDALTLVELLVSLVILIGLSLLMTVVLRALADAKAISANKLAQNGVLELEKGYTQYLASGGMIQSGTHITEVMQFLDAVDTISTTSTVTLNGYTPDSEISCGSNSFTCYRLNSGAVVAVRPVPSPTTTLGTDGYFDFSTGNATLEGSNSHQPIIVDPDGVFRATDPNSASVHLTLDSLGRLTPRAVGTTTLAGVEVTQAPYFDLQR